MTGDVYTMQLDGASLGERHSASAGRFVLARPYDTPLPIAVKCIPAHVSHREGCQ